jgi:hypothetical protein
MVAWVVRYHNVLLVSMYSHALHHVPNQVEMETSGYMCYVETSDYIWLQVEMKTSLIVECAHLTKLSLSESINVTVIICGSMYPHFFPVRRLVSCCMCLHDPYELK